MHSSHSRNIISVCANETGKQLQNSAEQTINSHVADNYVNICPIYSSKFKFISLPQVGIYQIAYLPKFMQHPCWGREEYRWKRVPHLFTVNMVQHNEMQRSAFQKKFKKLIWNGKWLLLKISCQKWRWKKENVDEIEMWSSSSSITQVYSPVIGAMKVPISINLQRCYDLFHT